MYDVFRAVTLSFLIAVLYLLLSAVIDYAEIYLQTAAEPLQALETRFRLALATSSLIASLLCVWVLLVTAFAKRYVSRLRPGSSLLTALVVAAPLVLITRLPTLIDQQGIWAPTLSLVSSMLWSSVGLHGFLWYITSGVKASSNGA